MTRCAGRAPAIESSRLSGAPCVVLDSNVVLSGLVFRQGRLAWLRQAWQAQRCLPLVSRTTTLELLRILAYPKFKLTAAEQQDLLADYLPFCRTVDIPAPPPATPPCRDPHDTPFLQLALAGGADILVSGDADLLAVVGFSIPILTPEALRTRLG